MLLFLNPTIKTQWKVWLFIQTFHCVFQHIHRRSSSFSALWIYTILKPFLIRPALWAVSLPYGFTLFSNCRQKSAPTRRVSLPYGFTLFSNGNRHILQRDLVSLPYGFTLFSNRHKRQGFWLTVSLPYGFTLFSNSSKSCIRWSAVSLPYGFTLFSNLHRLQ